VRKLGEGAFCTVHKWEDRAKRISGAVKIFPKSQIHSATATVQIATEFAMLQRLKHPNVVAFQGAVQGMLNLYLFMEMGGSRNLFQVIAAEGKEMGLSWSCTKGFFAQIASGIAYCHEMRVAHCDLKPENVVISESGWAKIVDFGQSLDLAEQVDALQSPRGTMPFTAPEVMLLKADWNPRAADVWSFAVIVVEMLCGVHAFVRLMGWVGRDLMIVSKLTQRANDLQIFFAKDETNAHANALAIIAGRCREQPPEFVIHLLGKMLEFRPENRIPVKFAFDCVENSTIIC